MKTESAKIRQGFAQNQFNFLRAKFYGSVNGSVNGAVYGSVYGSIYGSVYGSNQPAQTPCKPRKSRPMIADMAKKKNPAESLLAVLGAKSRNC